MFALLLKVVELFAAVQVEGLLVAEKFVQQETVAEQVVLHATER